MNKKFDVIIIGAGIGGLVCGCFLAKRGMKVLLLEQNKYPGGYCSSFMRKGFRFDIGIHSLGSCRLGGHIGTILEELGLNKIVRITKFDPSDTIITKNRIVNIRADINDTIHEFQKLFPRESRNIKKFINFIYKQDFRETSKTIGDVVCTYKNKTFRDVLDAYFSDEELKSTISILLGNLGLSSKETAAISGLILFKEFIFDGGYYPQGGMQAFSNALAKKIMMLGGVICYSEKVNQISIENGKIKGVITDNKNQFFSKSIVSAMDARQTYFNLIEKQWLNQKLLLGIKKLKPSASLFITYLGLNTKIDIKGVNGSNIWYFPHGNFDKIITRVNDKKDLYFNDGLFFSIPTRRDSNMAPQDSDIAILVVVANYASDIIWEKIRHDASCVIIKRMERLVPGISKKVIVKEIATPRTLHSYTSNYNGAMHGWASTNTTLNNLAIRPKAPIEGLYHAGHWTTLMAPGGTPGVVFSGKKTAELILSNKF